MMTPDWYQKNDAYLSAALHWLRLVLRHAAGTPPAPAPSIDPPRSHWWFGRSEVVHHKGEVRERPSGEELEHARVAMERAAQIDPPPALYQLAERMGMSQFERETLLLCVAMEQDTRIPGLCAAAQGDSARNYPTFALALALFADPAWDALSPERPLRYWRLIEINQAGAQPLTASSLRADERIVNAVKGLQYLDDRLTQFVLTAAPPLDGESLPGSQADTVDAIEKAWQLAGDQDSAPVVQLLGRDPRSKLLIASHAARRIGCSLYRMPVEFLPSIGPELELLARLWQRESLLLPIALFVDAQQLNPAAADSRAAALSRFLKSAGGIVFLAVREGWHHPGRDDIPVDVSHPTFEEQRALWRELLGEQHSETATQLAGQFNLDIAAIRRIAKTHEPAPLDIDLEEGAEPTDPPTVVDMRLPVHNDEALRAALWTACRRSVRPRLDALAQAIQPKATWDTLVLPPEPLAQLHQLADQVRNRSMVYQAWGFADRSERGLSINALFTGESGTGKTMAAEVLANDLDLNLYRIDLSAVVSKYIGETEENLRKLFDAAEDGGAILFFDEADALFGKRSEVKDSHDRYANIEINYLLQRMEAFQGLAILATNFKSALDTAFLRRLRFVVTFPFPGIEQRRLMWQKAFPMQTPTDALDYSRLARFNLNGGNISTIALNAAFLAAQAKGPVGMVHVLKSIRAELIKLERPINDADFR